MMIFLINFCYSGGDFIASLENFWTKSGDKAHYSAFNNENDIWRLIFSISQNF
jgi:hypothetical protein